MAKRSYQQVITRANAVWSQTYDETTPPPVSGLKGAYIVVLNKDTSNPLNVELIFEPKVRASNLPVYVPVGESDFHSNTLLYKGINILGPSTSYQILVYEIEWDGP